MPLTPCYQSFRSPWVRPVTTLPPPFNLRVPLMLLALVPYYLRSIFPRCPSYLSLSHSTHFHFLTAVSSLLKTSQMSCSSSIPPSPTPQTPPPCLTPFLIFQLPSLLLPCWAGPLLRVLSAPQSLPCLPTPVSDCRDSRPSPPHPPTPPPCTILSPTIKKFKLKRDAARVRL